MFGSELHSARGEEQPESAAPLVQQLLSEEFDTRRSAATKLVTLGEGARSALEQAVASDNLELRQAAAVLLQKLDKSNVVLLAFDRDGKPAGGVEADVKIYAAAAGTINWNDPKSELVTLNGEGRARLPDMSPGLIGLQVAWKKWSSPRDQASYWNVLLERGTNSFMMTLTHGGTVNAAVQDADGKPLKDAQIFFYNIRKFDTELLDLQLACTENWDRNLLSASSDAQGKIKYENLADGCYQCVYKSSDYRTALGAAFRIHEGESIDLPPVKLTPRSNGKLQLALKKADGSPLKKTRVGVNLEYLYEGPRAVELQRNARQLKMQLNMQRQAEWPETDDDGKLTMDDQRPGKYRLSVSSNSGDACWEPAEISIEAGKLAEAGTLKLTAGGSIKGKIVDSSGKGVQYCSAFAIPEDEAIDYEDGEPILDWRFMYQQFNGRNSVQSQADGGYEFTNLRPGRYALSISTRTGQPIVIYGVEVAPGKPTIAPDATSPGNAVTGVSQNVKGIVTLPDGKPANGASVNMISGFSRWGHNCDEKGVFTFSVGDQQQPSRLIVKAAECKPFVLDVSAPGTKLTELSIQLEKQEFGDLRIKVLDEAGQPLQGVAIRPVPKANRQNNYRQPGVDFKVTTNREGIARFSGMASGQRALLLEKDGYYSGGEVRSTVLANKESELVVSLKKGITVNGRVELPEGGDMGHTSVFLADAKSRVISVDKEGRFHFSGMAPGDYFFSPLSPGMLAQGRQKVSLKPDGSVLWSDEKDPTAELKLKLARPSGAAVALDPAFAGYQASLVPKGSWDPQVSQDVTVWYRSIFSTVDAAGRAEFWGAVDQEYDLVLTPAQVPYYNYRYYNNGSKLCTASLVAGTGTPQPLKSSADMKTLSAKEFKLDQPTGTLGGRLVCEPATGAANSNFGNMTLRIIGKNGFASLNYSFPSEFYQQVTRAPIILGNPPVGLKKTSEMGNFVVQGLPPGEYKIYADLQPYRMVNGAYTTDKSKQKQQPVPIAVCTIKPGERLNLGSVKYTLSAALLAELKAISENTGETEPEDRMQIFQP